MNKLSFYPILVFLLLVGFNAKAQYDTEVDLGVRANYLGVQFTGIDRNEVKSQGGTFQSNGLSFGGFFQLRVNHFYFQPELLYSRVSTKLGNQLNTGGAQPYTYGEYDFVFHSIEVPLLLGYRTSYGDATIRIGGGPTFSFLAKVNGELYLEPGPEVRDIPQDEIDAFNDITLGARVGLGVDVGSFIIDFMYERAFSKVGEEINRFTPVVSGEESSFLIGVGYKFLKIKR
ncbi:MAG: PorT family protein [Cytophagia bacterium]|nr:PorT family protein [Cytophagia bacterium]